MHVVPQREDAPPALEIKSGKGGAANVDRDCDGCMRAPKQVKRILADLKNHEKPNGDRQEEEEQNRRMRECICKIICTKTWLNTFMMSQ